MADENHKESELGSDLTPPDSYGEAALLLVESLLHALTEKAVITVAEAVEIVETAVEVEIEVASEAAKPSARRETIALLKAISTSLRHDL